MYKNSRGTETPETFRNPNSTVQLRSATFVWDYFTSSVRSKWGAKMSLRWDKNCQDRNENNMRKKYKIRTHKHTEWIETVGMFLSLILNQQTLRTKWNTPEFRCDSIKRLPSHQGMDDLTLYIGLVCTILFLLHASMMHRTWFRKRFVT